MLVRLLPGPPAVSRSQTRASSFSLVAAWYSNALSVYGVGLSKMLFISEESACLRPTAVLVSADAAAYGIAFCSMSFSSLSCFEKPLALTLNIDAIPRRLVRQRWWSARLW